MAPASVVILTVDRTASQGINRGMDIMLICQHCGIRRARRPRQLCWTCYYSPGVRESYPITSKFWRQGAGVGSRAPRPAAFPTAAAPGSLEKILVLTQRAELRQDLWHPEDATLDGAPTLARVG
jgi:hypothetical protein